MSRTFARLFYTVLWHVALPLVLAYFWRRGRRDPAYPRHLGERFGAGLALPGGPGAVWVHAVSLGEMRSAVPLVQALLDRGERVVTTHLTPAGRRAAETAFAPEIAAGRLTARYLPLELGWAQRRFLATHRPKLALVMEIEVWPVMIAEAARARVPLYLANSQYPARSYLRDRRVARIFGHPLRNVSGVFAKSEPHAERFRALGAPNVQVCGELRFDQPVPPALLKAAKGLLPAHRPAVAVTSVVAGEDALYLGIYQTVQAAFRARAAPAPLFIHIPRAPERFTAVGDMLQAAGQNVLRRSAVLDGSLAILGAPDFDAADILVGDSLGEMYFYLALSDIVVVGGGFLASGAHNVIEPLALKKPVLVGPNVWSIEYPAEEAAAAGVLTICDTPQALTVHLLALLDAPERLASAQLRAAAFFGQHGGATIRIMNAIAPLLDTDKP